MSNVCDEITENRGVAKDVSLFEYDFEKTKELIDLYFIENDKQNTAFLSPFEFLEKQSIETINENICEMFLSAMKHRKLLQLLAEPYRIYKERVTVPLICFYLLVFELNAETRLVIQNTLFKWTPKRCRSIIAYFFKDDHLNQLATFSIEIYDCNYVLENIMNPVVANLPIYRQMFNEINLTIKKRMERPKPHITRPISPNCLHRRAVSHPPATVVPCPTPQLPLKSTKIPRNLFVSNEKIKERIENAKFLNRLHAKKLLQYAQENQFKCAQIKTKPIVEQVPTTRIIKAKPIPVNIFHSSNPIKGTATTTLRNATHIVHQYQKEIDRLNQLTQGGFDVSELEAIESQIRREQYEANLNEIERKHLQGLLTREEAALAKLNLIKVNKAIVDECKEQHQQLHKQLEKWKDEQYQLNLEKIDRVIEIEQAAKAATHKLMSSRAENAREIDAMTRHNQHVIAEQRHQELMHKIEMIAEIRAIENVQKQLAKERLPKFDPTECKNVGLLCEMSLAELHERLQLVRIELYDQLEARRAKIHEQKMQRAQLLTDATCLVENERVRRQIDKLMDSKSTAPVCRQQNAEIENLKLKLNEKRLMKIQLQNSILTN